MFSYSYIQSPTAKTFSTERSGLVYQADHVYCPLPPPVTPNALPLTDKCKFGTIRTQTYNTITWKNKPIGLIYRIDVLRLSQSIRVMSSAVSVPNHTFPGQLTSTCAQSFARNWQLSVLNQRKRENDRRKYFMINLQERVLPDSAGIEPATPDHHSDGIRLSHRGRQKEQAKDKSLFNVRSWRSIIYDNFWIATWENVPSDMCAQRILISACPSAQSDCSLRCPHKETLHTLLFKCDQWTFWPFVQSDLIFWLGANVWRYVFWRCGIYNSTIKQST